MCSDEDELRGQAIRFLMWLDKTLGATQESPYTQAIKWLIWLDVPEHHRKEIWPEFQMWLAADTAHGRAYLQALRAWQRTGGLPAYLTATELAKLEDSGAHAEFVLGTTQTHH